MPEVHLGAGYLDGFEVLSSNPLKVRYTRSGRSGTYSNGALENLSVDYRYTGTAAVEGIAVGYFAITADYLPAPELTIIPTADGNRNRVVTWTKVTGDTEYWVEKAANPAFSDSFGSGWIREQDYVFSDLNPGTKYFYRVKSRIAGQTIESPWSAVQAASQQPLPATARNWTLYQ